MPKTVQDHRELSWDGDGSANVFQVGGGVGGVVAVLTGAIEASEAAGTYWAQVWDGDPDSGGSFITSIPVEHDGTNDTPIPTERLHDNGVYASDIWINISEAPLSNSGSAGARIVVGYQADQDT